MSTIFRIATMQAIKEIVEDSAVSGRFGLILTEEGMEEISKKVVDLFEMTLELRSKTQEIFNPTPQANYGKTQKEENNSFIKTKNAAEIYDNRDNKKNMDGFGSALNANLDVKLPRKKFELSLAEKEKFQRR